MGATNENLHVFISYSRDDLEFADQLAAGLRVAGIDSAIDRHGISGGEDWRRRLGSLIRDAETVVFVLSPSSARSEICGWEVEEATRLGKRILPVVCRPLETSVVPPHLQSLNYVFFFACPKSPGSGFGAGLEQLVDALNTDIDWLREHTRYLQRATEWDIGGRPANRLLSGADIGVAKAWVARKPKGAPEPTSLHLDFIRASEEWEAQQQNEERKRLEEVARAQEERAKALTDAEIAQKREAEASKRAEAEALRAAEEATRAASAAKTIAKRTAAGLAVALVLVVIASGVGFYALKKRQEALAQTQVAQQALRVSVAWEYTEKDPYVSAAFLREAREPANIRGWRGATGKTLEILGFSSKIPLGGAQGAISARFSPDGRRIVTASEDGTVKVWDSATGAEIAMIRGHFAPVVSAEFSPDGSRIITASEDKTVRIWDAGTDQELLMLRGHTGALSTAAFSPDGKLVITASDDRTVKLWNAASGEEIATLVGHDAAVVSAAFSPDGRRIVTASADKTARIWGGETGQPLLTLRGHTGALSNAAFSPDGKLIVTASRDGTARIWDVENARELVVIRHGEPVWAARFSSDGRHVATACEDGKARLWTLNGLIDSVFNVSGKGLISADYSPGGSKLVAVSSGGTVEILTILPDIESLLAQLWKATSNCPDGQTRIYLLGQPEAEADRDYNACIQAVSKQGSPQAKPVGRP